MSGKNHLVVIRVNPEEKEKLERLAKMEGHSTLTSFCRQRLFQSISTELKLNSILKLLEENKSNNIVKEKTK